MERRYVDTAEQAKLMRAVLRESFPGVKFSVRTDRYSGGSCVRVSWTGGPTEKAVSAVARQLDGTYFDSAIDYAGSVYHTLDGEPVGFSGSVSCSRHHSDEQTTLFRGRWERLSVHRRARLLEEHGLSGHYRPEDNDAWCPIMCGWDFYGKPAQESATLARIACSGSDAYGCSETALAVDAAAKGTEPAPVYEPEQPPAGYRLQIGQDDRWGWASGDRISPETYMTRGEAIAAAREDASKAKQACPAITPRGALAYITAQGETGASLRAMELYFEAPADQVHAAVLELVENGLAWGRQEESGGTRYVAGQSPCPPTNGGGNKAERPAAPMTEEPPVSFLPDAWGSDGAVALLGGNVVAFPTARPALSITLERAEGWSEECGKPVTVHSFAAANAVLRQWSETAPGPKGGYHKYDFTLEVPALGWNEPYSGRFDLHHWSVEEPDLRAHIRDFWTFYLGERCPAHLTAEQYRTFLAHNGLDAETAAETRRLLELVARVA